MFRKLLNLLKHTFPGFFGAVFRLRDLLLIHIPAHLSMLRFRKTDSTEVKVFYLTTHFPKRPATRNEHAHGGSVKLTYLSENFPHCFPATNLLYTVSSVGHPLQVDILHKARNAGVKIVVNQNGVAFPAWDGANFENSNRSLKQIIEFADFIIYQSQFCKDSAERYISPPDVPNKIIYNPVDTCLFSPDACPEKPEALTLLLGGNQYEKYRLELALQTLKALHRDMPNAKLIVTGNLWLPRDEAETWTKQALHDMNLTNHVTFTGTYAQTDAPALYSQAHLLLHTKYADPSPGLVLEAMALGMPVVHLSNGGVPELVGDAGIGVAVQHDWNMIRLPDPQSMADAVLEIYSRRKEYSHIARQRAIELFSLDTFISRHSAIFDGILEQ